jgi:hypothetical protein
MSRYQDNLTRNTNMGVLLEVKAMETKAKYEILTTPVGTAKWAYLFNPDTQFHTDGLYHVEVSFSKEESKSFIDVIERTIAEEMKANPNKKKSTHPTYKLTEDGKSYEFKFKLKAKVNWAKGSFEQRPKIYNSSLEIMDQPVAVYNGSKLKVAFEVVPYVSAFGVGVTLRMRSIQILELAPKPEGKGDSKSNDSGTYGFKTEKEFAPVKAKNNTEKAEFSDVVSQEEETDF